MTYRTFKKIGSLLFFVLLGSLTGCEEKEEEQVDEEQLVKELDSLPQNEVAVMEMEMKSFNEELISNGKLVANQKSILKFNVTGSLENLYVNNGDKVQKSQVLASLKNFRYQQELEQADINLKKARLELEDMLVGRGYDLDNRDSIPDHIYEMATLRSGYQEALYRQETSRFDVNSSTIEAPFSGKVANINYKEFEQVGAGSEFLTLIDDTSFEVVFSIIESEIEQVKVGNTVEVVTFGSGKKYRGKVEGINPVVDENGTMEVTAKVKNDGGLVEGMNVRVRIQKTLPNKFVVPKAAVVIRQDQEVLFKVQDGRAYWTYVKVTNENNDSYAIIPDPEKNSAVINIGDSIIVSNNVNLAHDSEVVVRNTSIN